MKFDKERLYNPEVKIHFLEESGLHESVVMATYSTLMRTAVTERRLNKDLYEMHEQEIEEVLYELTKRSARDVAVTWSRIKNYIEWAGRIYSNKKFPLFAGVTFSHIAHKYVSTSLVSLHKLEELIEIYEKMDNVYDKALIQCLFEGIKGKRYSEIFNLKAEDRFIEDGKYYINLYDTEEGTERTLEISELLYNLIEEANQESIYKDHKTGRDVILNMNSPYVFKKSSRALNNPRTAELRVGDAFVYTKMKMYQEIFKTPAFKYTNIINSGLMHYLYEEIKDQPEDVKVITFDAMKVVRERFGIKEYLHSEALVRYTSYHLIKDRIDEDYFKEEYTNFVYQTK